MGGRTSQKNWRANRMLKIVFICGSLEPGRDGVGDYTRRMAGELVRQTHTVAILALHDKYLSSGVLESSQQDEHHYIPTLRLSSQLPWKERVKKSLEFIQLIDPQWISLQFVAFAFEKRGLPFGLSNVLAELTRNRKVHVMFHELWVGVESNSSLKKRLWGQLQRLIIRELLTRLKPSVVHTQSRLYQHMLTTLGYVARIAPLFGNIPVVVSNGFNGPASSTTVSFVTFGGIHEDALIQDFAANATEYAQENKVPIKFVFVGNNGRLLNEWLTVLAANGLETEVMGEQPTDVISEVLSDATFGLTSTPMLLTDKSGSVAAMKEHGLRIVCVRGNWRCRYTLSGYDESIIQYKAGNFRSLFDTQINADRYAPSLQKTTAGMVSVLEGN